MRIVGVRKIDADEYGDFLNKIDQQLSGMELELRAMLGKIKRENGPGVYKRHFEKLLGLIPNLLYK